MDNRCGCLGKPRHRARPFSGALSMLFQPIKRLNCVRRCAFTIALFCATLIPVCVAWAQPQLVELRNGMLLGPGIVSETDSISIKSSERPRIMLRANRFYQLDDGLRYTYVNKSARNIIANRDSTAQADEQIILASDGEASNGRVSRTSSASWKSRNSTNMDVADIRS